MAEKTTNYSMFKKFEGNRELNNALLKKLENSIQSKDLLEFRPILIDEKKRVVDGQHRLEIAKKLGIAIYYEIKKNCDAHDIILLNANQKSWNLTDYLNFHVQSGNKECCFLNDYIKKENIPLRIAISLLHGSNGSSKILLDSIRTGTYKFPDKQEVSESKEMMWKVNAVKDYINKKISGDKEYLKTQLFLRALVEFLIVKSVDFKTFMNKLEYKLDLMRPCSRLNNYLMIFKEIYNWRNNLPVDFEQAPLIKARKNSLFEGST